LTNELFVLMLLTASLIVRNEENYLADCLKSIQGIVDEIIVVDTGSKDQSIAIARSSGAKVIHYEWCDDFSAARNVALDHSSGEWILYIDADEYVEPISRIYIERLLAESSKIAYTVLLYAKKGFTAYREYRIFKKDSRIRFTGAIYESIYPSICTMTIDPQAFVGKSDLTIIHAVQSKEEQYNKNLRNLPLIVKQIKKTPHKSDLLWRLGVTYKALGNKEEAIESWKKALDIVRQKTDLHILDSLCYVELIRIFYEQGRDITSLLDEALECFPYQYLLIWMKAKFLVKQKAFDKAIPLFENLMSVTSRCPGGRLAYDKNIFSKESYEPLMLCYVKCAKYRELKKLSKDKIVSF